MANGRERWGTRLGFVLAAAGSAVGLGNLWRFPYLTWENGGALFVLVGMLYERRHTHAIQEYGGLATPMPVLAALFLFISMASAGLPMLNGFVGEFLILAGTFGRHPGWAASAVAGIIFSAVYLLWAYQRTFLGNVGPANSNLTDASRRERAILLALAAVILWMGVASPSVTRRTESATRNVFELMQRPHAYNAEAAPLRANPSSTGVR